MITKFLLFEDVDSIEGAKEDFRKFNPFLDIEKWNFFIVGYGRDSVKVKAEPKNGRSFYVISPVHFLRWSTQ